MFNVTAHVDTKRLDDVIFALQALGANRLPATAQAVETSTKAVQQRWIDNTEGAFKYPTGSYLAGIQDGLEYPYERDIYKGAVINTVPYAQWIEHGTPAHDMKRMLFTSTKVRISAKGKRYLIIPFRHGTPSAGSHEGGIGESRATLRTMPKAVYAMAKNLGRSRMAGAYYVNNPAAGNTPVIRYSYQWSNKLTQGDLNVAGLGNVNRRPHWKSSPYAGMVRFPRHEATGQSQYMTFRVMHEDSTGWIHPGTPPKNLAKKTADEMAPVVVRIIEKGFDTDMRNYLGQA